MQFIATGNRIAVENFVLGDLYTITFTSGIYINSACIGIGENFVSFQRNEPELLFTLNMETAELVSSIDLYAGGTGTTNYENLTNKPQINDVELVGNKSLSDLGIQPTISDIDTIRSGAAAGATAVQPDALTDYQPKIDSSHKLDADLVDDTSSTHKFATADQLSQIGINANNIALINNFKYSEVTIILSDLTWTQGGSGEWYSTPVDVPNAVEIVSIMWVTDSYIRGTDRITPHVFVNDRSKIGLYSNTGTFSNSNAKVTFLVLYK